MWPVSLSFYLFLPCKYDLCGCLNIPHIPCVTSGGLYIVQVEASHKCSVLFPGVHVDSIAALFMHIIIGVVSLFLN